MLMLSQYWLWVENLTFNLFLTMFNPDPEPLGPSRKGIIQPAYLTRDVVKELVGDNIS